MEKLDEDDLLELHTRVRRARSKYVKLYRQTGASRVGTEGQPEVTPARGTSPTPPRPRCSSWPWPGSAPASTWSPAPPPRSSRPSGSPPRRAPARRARGRSRPAAAPRPRREHPSTRHEDHRWPQARRVVARQGCCATGEEGLPLTAGLGSSSTGSTGRGTRSWRCMTYGDRQGSDGHRRHREGHVAWRSPRAASGPSPPTSTCSGGSPRAASTGWRSTPSTGRSTAPRCTPSVAALADAGAALVVRVPAVDPVWIGAALDAGAAAVVVPSVTSSSRCRARGPGVPLPARG